MSTESIKCHKFIAVQIKALDHNLLPVTSLRSSLNIAQSVKFLEIYLKNLRNQRLSVIFIAAPQNLKDCKKIMFNNKEDRTLIRQISLMIFIFSLQIHQVMTKVIKRKS